MAIIIQTRDPSALLDAIYNAIDNKQIDKWTRTDDGRLTLSAMLWKNEAWFKPQIWVDENELRFGLLKRKDRRHVSSKLYTLFHTRMVETLLAHFDKDFQSVAATALKTEPDNF
ncbi:MAG: hypothetical protein LBR48_03550 [Dysgonamonadaceae bacterium]|jgi:hypothetical protein|nr:hypothetical protein [Dysgonamonadaceae bacterium]